MILQESVESYCPYCSEPIQLLVDTSVIEQHYIEDCQVCCRPMVISAYTDNDEEVSVIVKTEDE